MVIWIMIFVIMYAILIGYFLSELVVVFRMYYKDEYTDIKYGLKREAIRLSLLIVIALILIVILLTEIYFRR